ncbi:MAG: deoxyribodipyrimidine photolyase [Burkholderiales bacterium]|nr:deoxyribodipyrimidine photolyase [Burkholderiales bacterium]
MPSNPDHFEPTNAALEARLSEIDIAAYSKTRNHLSGQVTRLSPYITHGFISIPELFDRLPELKLADKLAFEFGWREFFHHVWSREGERILSDLRPALPGVRYTNELPEDIREGRTGLAVIDRAVHELYSTGYLHNHARMWLASYVVHLRKVSWRTGADWMFAHLVDGDLASNYLSWQWVAATFSSKPYLFNAENVARYAPADWHCAGSVLDTSYEQLDQIARSDQTVTFSPSLLGMAEPELLSKPPAQPAVKIARADRIRLVHPWMLAEQPFEGQRIGVIHLPFHTQFPWSALRWRFVVKRLEAITDTVFVGDLNELKDMLSETPYVESVATLNPGYDDLLPQLCTQLADAPRQFANPAKTCRSFSAFWSQCTEAYPQRGWHR